jgi:hypothetical protein
MPFSDFIYTFYKCVEEFIEKFHSPMIEPEDPEEIIIKQDEFC